MSILFLLNWLPEGWTVILRRGQFGLPADYFRRNYVSYLEGFGDPRAEFWLGLERIWALTSVSGAQFNIKLEVWLEKLLEIASYFWNLKPKFIQLIQVIFQAYTRVNFYRPRSRKVNMSVMSLVTMGGSDG